ncbi:isoamylase early set domain-containing protein [Celerinatantimonas sp. YJH-8]|uniref:isoamylase early set domain-containing protein n=1 Tax=Celerinatantimonas sp. YJH-8 TaxID=3228714 RepID=UPI0038BFD07A
MALKKQYLKSKPEVRVTFEVSKEAANNASRIFLLGEFNQWEPVELDHMKNGKFKIVVKLPTDQQSSYQFRYKLCDASGKEYFENDWNADAYCPNLYGEENSVITVTH